MQLLDEVAQVLDQLPQTNRYLIAYSGGVDSTVLLHLLMHLKPGAITALHLNHHLQSQSSAWQQHCQQQCANWHIPCISKEIQITASSNIEAEARKARYRFFSELIQAGDLLLTAHHLNDQVETLFLNLMRSSGVDGLAAMPLQRQFAEGYLCRPLLNMTKKTLKAYAEHQHLNWIEDKSNLQDHFGRNHIRNQIISRLEERWPKAMTSIARSAELLGETAILQQAFVKEKLALILSTDKTIHLSGLKDHSEQLQKLLIRQWIKDHQLPPLSSKQLGELIRQIKQASQTNLQWQGAEIRSYKDLLFAQWQAEQIDHEWQTGWDGHQPLKLPGDLGVLELSKPTQVLVRLRKEGDHMHINGQRKSLKKLFQQLELPPWKRWRVPVVEHQGQILFVGDYLKSDETDFSLSWIK